VNEITQNQEVKAGMEDSILHVVSRYVIPIMQVYGLYIIFHGHESPGGGFAGGMVLGVGLVLYSLVFGLSEGQKRVPSDLAMVGGLVLILTIFGELLIGGVFEIGIGLIVALVALSIFSSMVEEVDK
jgi:multicomponent Na+:H+ antiporter subunit B